MATLRLNTERRDNVEPSSVRDLHNAFRVHRDELMTAFNHSEGKYGRKMTLDLVDEGWDIGVPNAYFVIETCTEEEDHGLVEGKAQDSPDVLLVDPFFF